MAMELNNNELVQAFGGTDAKTTAVGDKGYEGFTHWVASVDVDLKYPGDKVRTVLSGSVRAFTGDYEFNGVYDIEVM